MDSSLDIKTKHYLYPANCPSFWNVALHLTAGTCSSSLQGALADIKVVGVAGITQHQPLQCQASQILTLNSPSLFELFAMSSCLIKKE